MGLFSTLAAVAPFAGYALGGPIGGMAAGGIAGALAGNERNQELNERQRRSANASADAIAASWARRDGKGSIPAVQYNTESGSGNMGAGTFAGLMQGYALKNGGLFDSKGGLLGNDYQVGDLAKPNPLNFNALQPNLGSEGAITAQPYKVPTLFGTLRR